MQSRRNFITMVAGSYFALHPSLTFAQTKGKFSGNPVLESFGKLKRLVKEFRYRDPKGTLWTVPAGYMTNGASIPRILWTLAGGPFSGSHGDAAIIHDYYCDTMERSWQATHRVFYHAMIDLGVSEFEAKTKYWAVYKWGPRWNSSQRWDTALGLNSRPRGSTHYLTGATDKKSTLAKHVADHMLLEHQMVEFEAAKSAIKLGGLNIEEIETLALNDSFAYDQEFNKAKFLIDQYAVETKEGQLLLPREYMTQPDPKFLVPAGTDIEAVLNAAAGRVP